MHPKVDRYLAEGCGRCSLYRTPQCKVHTWPLELRQLRRIASECGLQETFKWSQPCYTYNNRNIVMVTAFREFAALAFFKGALLKDPHGILVSPGKNSQAARQIRFTDAKDIVDMESVLKGYIHEAIEVEKAGLKVNFKKETLPLPEELQAKFSEFPALKSAFESLTPGRQRGYIIYFSQPKQSATRSSRIEKYRYRILEGKGLHDR